MRRTQERMEGVWGKQRIIGKYVVGCGEMPQGATRWGRRGLAGGGSMPSVSANADIQDLVKVPYA
jgi:hypothetical protein